MKIYNFNKITGEFLGESTAHIDPLETQQQEKNVYLMPANATLIAPPTVNKNEVAIFNGEQWEIKKDFRGQKVFNKNSREETTIKNIGEIDANFTKIAPANEYQVWSNESNKWVIDESKRAIILRQLKDNINFERDSKGYEPIEYNNKLYKADVISQNDITTAALQSLAYPNLFPKQWISEDGAVELSVADIQGIALAIGNRRQTLVYEATTKKEALEALSTEQLIEKLT